jgi:hypothetical protein
MKFNATLYVMPDTICIYDIEAWDSDEAYDKALEIAIRKYTRVGWELDHLELEEVKA